MVLQVLQVIQIHFCQVNRIVPYKYTYIMDRLLRASQFYAVSIVLTVLSVQLEGFVESKQVVSKSTYFGATLILKILPTRFG